MLKDTSLVSFAPSFLVDMELDGVLTLLVVVLPDRLPKANPPVRQTVRQTGQTDRSDRMLCSRL